MTDDLTKLRQASLGRTARGVGAGRDGIGASVNRAC